MKLLQPNAVRDEQGKETSLDLLRVQETKKFLKDLEMQRAKAEADFQTTLSKNLAKWEAEEAEHAKHIAEREREIEKLEEEKLNMLIPFGILKEGTDDRFTEAEKFLGSLREREERVEELTERLEDKLDELGDREQGLNRSEELYAIRQEGLEQQTESLKDQSAQLTLQIADFIEKERLHTEAMRKRETEIVFQERTLESREDNLKKKEQELELWSIRLHEERKLLQDAWDELKRKQS